MIASSRTPANSPDLNQIKDLWHDWRWLRLSYGQIEIKIKRKLNIHFTINILWSRYLIFISPIGMKILGSATRWHFDGTFKICPTHFHQILSIHCLNQNRMFPAAYILLQNKELETYIKAFTSVKEILVSNNYALNVQDALTDFELALIQAIRIF
ncbi:hypothetical protein BpHYR1_043030 [Brachionus plicatilis]|uniref:MULE transposase domain-containing protein n=1 Tax=Brachionus plicatilis TaxID=10195 RepID=A0A3M7QLC4_BRAPC|nr:hypothetical protein BpHYR1_043030 [Brachionus plicatilis]